MQKDLEFREGASAKFWRVVQTGSELAVTFGRIGTAGQTQTRALDTPAAARAEAEKLAAGKIKKGYVVVAVAKPATKVAAAYAFPFVGQGFGTSYKCLECYAWFENAPSKALQTTIKAALPPPVATFARFQGDLLHFGSDDDLELRVKAAYEPEHAGKPANVALRDVTARATAGKRAPAVLFPTPKTWKAFCADFERAMLAIHAIAPLRFVLKPDEQHTPGAWGQWSRLEAYRAAEWALADSRKPSAALGYFALNLFESLEGPVLKRMSPNARESLLRFADKLHARGPGDLREEFAECAELVLEGFPAKERATRVAGLSKSLRAELADD